MIRTVLGAMAGFALATAIGDAIPHPDTWLALAGVPAHRLEASTPISPTVISEQQRFLATLPAEGAAQACSSVTDTTDSSTEFLLKSMYTLGCSFESRNCNGVTCRFTANCCAPSAWVRVNQGDWNLLRDQGKLSGLRYQMIVWSGNTSSIVYKKINGATIEMITSAQFLP